jgi:hypothetical protein
MLVRQSVRQVLETGRSQTRVDERLADAQCRRGRAAAPAGLAPCPNRHSCYGV